MQPLLLTLCGVYVCPAAHQLQAGSLGPNGVAHIGRKVGLVHLHSARRGPRTLDQGVDVALFDGQIAATDQRINKLTTVPWTELLVTRQP